MKTTKLILLFTIAMATLSCSSDDDNGPEPYTLSTNNFVDTYKMKFLEVIEVETITFSNGSTSTSTSTTVGSVFQNVQYEFNSDNTFTATGLYNTQTTITNPDGSTTVEDPIIVNLDESGTYALNTGNSKVTITDDDGNARAFEIKDYKETGMTLFSENTTILDNSSTTITKEYRFSK
ncbi:hypothetical protein [Aequorivita marina]|uniref:hypothetical protein n=1 Tax=Aequorivita marina TaxID=3073654 RepID=UPI002874C20F|nr:hypothetical protein [Aequorivita sp. S2608]MDS1298838.1 hypothetical protein [Aequorivita sp. S2608]